MKLILTIKFRTKVLEEVSDIMRHIEPGFSITAQKAARLTIDNVKDDLSLAEYDKMIAAVKKEVEKIGWTDVTIIRETK